MLIQIKVRFDEVDSPRLLSTELTGKVRGSIRYSGNELIVEVILTDLTEMNIAGVIIERHRIKKHG